MLRYRVPVFLLAASVVASPAHAVLIDFEDQPDMATVGSPIVYPEASFSSSTGNFLINASGEGRDICPIMADCQHVLSVNFAGLASNISFLTRGETGSMGDVGSIEVFAGAMLLATLDIITDGNGFTNDLQSVPLGGVTRLVIEAPGDQNGLSYDDFQFDLVSVPAPAVLALLGVGIAVIATRRAPKPFIC